MNKSKKSSKERIDFLLQDKWNNFSLKICGCKSHSYCKNVQRNKLFVERKRRKTIGKEKNDCVQWVNFFFFFVKDSFKNNDVAQNEFLKDLGLFVQNYLPIHFVENIWCKRLVLHFCPKLNFLSGRQFLRKILPWLVEKTRKHYVFPTLENCFFTITCFHLLFSRGAYDVFTLMINFLGSDQQLKHVTICLFEATKITSQTLA